jgi:hypothetical protein
MIGGNFEVSKMVIKDSTIMGQTDLLPSDSGSFCIASYGMHLSNAAAHGKFVPELKLSSLPYEKIMGYGNWYTEAEISNVIFKNWNQGSRS